LGHFTRAADLGSIGEFKKIEKRRLSCWYAGFIRKWKRVINGKRIRAPRHLVKVEVKVDAKRIVKSFHNKSDLRRRRYFQTRNTWPRKLCMAKPGTPLYCKINGVTKVYAVMAHKQKKCGPTVGWWSTATERSFIEEHSDWVEYDEDDYDGTREADLDDDDDEENTEDTDDEDTSEVSTTSAIGTTTSTTTSAKTKTTTTPRTTGVSSTTTTSTIMTTSTDVYKSKPDDLDNDDEASLDSDDEDNAEDEEDDVSDDETTTSMPKTSTTTSRPKTTTTSTTASTTTSVAKTTTTPTTTSTRAPQTTKTTTTNPPSTTTTADDSSEENEQKTWTKQSLKQTPTCRAVCNKQGQVCRILRMDPVPTFGCKDKIKGGLLGHFKKKSKPQYTGQTWTLQIYKKEPSCKTVCEQDKKRCRIVIFKPEVKFGCS